MVAHMRHRDVKLDRAFVSFGGPCPYQCKHCYTFHNKYTRLPQRSIDDLVRSLKGKQFDVVYISGHRENFVIPDQGISLVEAIFERYECDILFTTRSVFQEQHFDRLMELNNRMRSGDRRLYACVSIPAYDSFRKIEAESLIPSPQERIDSLGEMYLRGLTTILTLRPLFPKDFIPIEDVKKVLDLSAHISSAVISSGIVLETEYDARLEWSPREDQVQEKAALMPCLDNPYDVLYVDVNEELTLLGQRAVELGVPFFTDSSTAIGHLKNLSASVRV